MGGILGKILKGKDLLSQLKEHYPSKDVQPFGKVLMIPNSDFRGCWKDELASKGIKTFVQAVGGQSVFLVKVEEADKPDAEKDVALSSPIQEPDRIVKPVAWTTEENTELQALHSQGVSCKDIALKLQRSVHAVAAKIGYLPKPQNKMKNLAVEKSHDDVEIKELLGAAEMVFPQYRHASATLLREAAAKMEN